MDVKLILDSFLGENNRISVRGHSRYLRNHKSTTKYVIIII